MSDDFDVLKRWLDDEGTHALKRVRLLMLLDAADYAVITPVSTSRLHAFAYLADVLSPVYDLAPIARSIRKRRTGPYYPELQWELDRLVGMGLVEVFDLNPVVERARAYIDAAFALERDRCETLLAIISKEKQFAKLKEFFQELAGALADVPDIELDATTSADATWESGAEGAVIDYADWRARNYSRAGADRVGQLASEMWARGSTPLSPAAKINLYVRYMKRAANG
jgi:hypothetical protein